MNEQCKATLAAYRENRNNSVIKIFKGGEIFATYWATERRKTVDEMSDILTGALEVFKKSNDFKRVGFHVSLFVDNQEFLYIEKEYRLYPEKSYFEVWQTKRINENGLNRWEAFKKIATRKVEINLPEESKPAKEIKGAIYVKHWLKPEVVRIQWGKSQYDYYLNSIDDLNTFLWLKQTAGVNKAALWLKSHARKCEKVTPPKEK